jgi:hypothetical protein
MSGNATDLPLADSGVSLTLFGNSLTTVGPLGVSATGCGGNPCYSLSGASTFIDPAANWVLGSGSAVRGGASSYNNTYPAYTISNFSALITNATDIYGKTRGSTFDIGAINFAAGLTGGGGRWLFR